MNDYHVGSPHGLAGFQTGCRCGKCFSAESARARRIARSETLRWTRINGQADRHWDRRSREDEPERRENEHKRWTRDDIELALDTSISAADSAAILGRSIDAVETVRRRVPQ